MKKKTPKATDQTRISFWKGNSLLVCIHVQAANRALCLPCRCGCQPFFYAASFSLMHRVKEHLQAAQGICHCWAKGQAAALFLTIVFSCLLLVSAIFQHGRHHSTSETLPSYNNKAASAQVKARARQIQEQLRRLINSFASLLPYLHSLSAICNCLPQQKWN